MSQVTLNPLFTLTVGLSNQLAHPERGRKLPETGSMLGDVAQLLFPALLILAGIFDSITLKIPNWLVALIVVLFFPIAFALSLPPAQYLTHAIVAVAVLAAGFALYACRIFGAGDAKLLAAAALWFGWPALVPFVVYTALAGGVLAMIVLVWALFRTDQEIRGYSWIAKLESFKPNVPYGAAIAAGGILAYPQTWWMSS